MTSHQAQLQVLITEIESLLGKATPKLPWVMAEETNQQRQVLEQALVYLRELHAARALPGDWSDAEPLMSEDGSPDAELTGQRVLQALLQEMQFLRTQTVQPLTAEIADLQQQRQGLKAEINQLERSQAELVGTGALQQSNPPWVNDIVEQLRAVVVEQITTQLKALPAQSVDVLSLSGSEASPASAVDLPPLRPQQRLEQLQQIESQTDYLLLQLDSNLRAVFESMEQSIQSYCDSLTQGLNDMHSLGQQGEVIFRAFVNHLAQQLGDEPGYLAAEEEPSRLLEGEPDYPDYFQGTTRPPVDGPAGDGLINFDDIDLDTDIQDGEEVTLFQLDEEITQLQLGETGEARVDENEGIAPFPDENAAAYQEAPVTAPQDDEKTVIQTEPIPWEEAIGLAPRASSDVPFAAGAAPGEDSEPADSEESDSEEYVEEIDALYDNLFGDTLEEDNIAAEPEAAVAGAASADIDGNEALDEVLLVQGLEPIEIPAGGSDEEAEHPDAPLPSASAVDVSLEGLLEAEAPLLDPTTVPAEDGGEALEMPAVRSESTADDGAIANGQTLDTFLATALGDDLDFPEAPAEEGIETITSLADLFPDRASQGSAIADAAEDLPLEERFMEAPQEESLLVGQGEMDDSAVQAELSLDNVALEQLAEDLASLEDITLEGDAPEAAAAASNPFAQGGEDWSDGGDLNDESESFSSEALSDMTIFPTEIQSLDDDAILPAVAVTDGGDWPLEETELSDNSPEQPDDDGSPSDVADFYNNEEAVFSLGDITLDLDLTDPPASMSGEAEAGEPPARGDDFTEAAPAETEEILPAAISAFGSLSEETDLLVDLDLTSGLLDSFEDVSVVSGSPAQTEAATERVSDWDSALDEISLDLDLSEDADPTAAEPIVEATPGPEADAAEDAEAMPPVVFTLEDSAFADVFEGAALSSLEFEPISLGKVDLELSLDNRPEAGEPEDAATLDMGDDTPALVEDTTGAEPPPADALQRGDNPLPEDLAIEGLAIGDLAIEAVLEDAFSSLPSSEPARLEVDGEPRPAQDLPPQDQSAAAGPEAPAPAVTIVGSPSEGFSLAAEPSESELDLEERLDRALSVLENPSQAEAPGAASPSVPVGVGEAAWLDLLEDESSPQLSVDVVEVSALEALPSGADIDLTHLDLPDFGSNPAPEETPVPPTEALPTPETAPADDDGSEPAGLLSDAELTELFPPSSVSPEADSAADLFPASFEEIDRPDNDAVADSVEVPLPPKAAVDLSSLDALFNGADEENLEASFFGEDVLNQQADTEDGTGFLDNLEVPTARHQSPATLAEPETPTTTAEPAVLPPAVVDVPVDSSPASESAFPNADEPPSVLAGEEWFLGIDLGTSGLSAVLMDRVGGTAHPLCWTADASGAEEPTFRLPSLANLENQSAVRDAAANGQAVGLVAPSAHQGESNLDEVGHLKHLLGLGIPFQKDTGTWEPTLRGSNTLTLPLQQVFEGVLTLLRQLRLYDATVELGAVGLETPKLGRVLQALQGVVVGYPAQWPETYQVNLREAILAAGIVTDPAQIFFMEDAIAAILSGLPDPSEPPPAPSRQVQTLYQCSWQGSTVVVSAGASCTTLGLVDLPSPLDTLSQEDFTLRSYAYGGDALDLDIISQLLLAPERRKRRASAESSSSPGTASDWRPTRPIAPDTRWDSLDWDALTLPQLAESDEALRSLMRQSLASSALGQGLLEAAKYLKQALQTQGQVTLSMADQSWRVLRRDLESRILVPYIQRMNQHLNGLIAATTLAPQGVNQVICTGGNVSFSTIARWLRQKFPNATIIQDTYPENRSPSCSRVAYGLVNLCRYPQILEVPRHQYNAYFLLYRLIEVIPDQPMPLEGILHLLAEQGIDTEACGDRIQSLLENRLPNGIVADELAQVHLCEPSQGNALAECLAQEPLFMQQSNQIYSLNGRSRDLVRAHLEKLFDRKRQALDAPLIAQLVVP